MHDPSPAATVDGVAHPTVPGRSLTFERRWAASSSEQLERTRLIEQARDTDAAAHLRLCCQGAAQVLESLSWRALTRLAANEPVDPNDPDNWCSPDAHAQIVLRRHGSTGLDSTRLTMEAVRALIDGQARADREAGLEWTPLDMPGAALDAEGRPSERETGYASRPDIRARDQPLELPSQARTAQWTCSSIVSHTAARQPRSHTGFPVRREDHNVTASWIIASRG